MPHTPTQSTLPVPCFEGGSNRGIKLVDGVAHVSGQSSTSPIDNVLLAAWDVSAWLDAPILADGYQMLCQWQGSLRAPVAVSRCADNDADYRRYPAEQTRFYNYLLIELEPDNSYWLVGFADCHQFNGYFECRHDSQLVAVVETESLCLEPDQTAVLPTLVSLQADSITAVFGKFSTIIQSRHGTPKIQQSVKGWCSWYHYYEHITTDIIADNAKQLAQQWTEADLVLIDDGYQRAMGDWLIPSNKFAGGVEQAIDAITSTGCRPGIWLAPFIAQLDSQLYKEHPDWFVHHADGSPLLADSVTYGGWRCTPWLLLDTSQDAPCEFLQHTVDTMKQQWGIALFKLDALYWGALDVPRAHPMTSVQAYRRGLAAIKRGAGDACVLGCNAPMWPSLGLVDAMRTSDDIHRHQHRFNQLHLENAGRSWQHRALWLLDQDCLTLENLNTEFQQQSARPEAYEFHASSILAHGGNLILGDAMNCLSASSTLKVSQLLARLACTEQVVDYQSLAFDRASLILDDNTTLFFAFHTNAEVSKTFNFQTNYDVDWFDFWQGIALADQCQALQVEVAPNQARVVVAKRRL
ncbi:alpha-galactosidase [Neiella marina]|uniref:Alpha-galactosidase n=1 Tax=Neiella holothuriorum TaxID=2870530 RepID=A0ABS7EEC8_9GAMM|nr:glycoside hydrolase family 36 protein [Neiella holothuriorum]MBW8190166.1 alpha-galactosidase [Neiella holothuriorum]